MSLRELVSYRASLVKIRGTAKNGLHAYLLINNIQMDCCRSLRALGRAEEGRRC